MSISCRKFEAEHLYHIYNRGTQKMRLFYETKDYEYFLNCIKKYQKKFPVKIEAYCIMPNHFHLLLKEPNHQVPKSMFKTHISNFMHHLQSAFAKYFNCKHTYFSGRVFQGTFKSKLITDEKYYYTLIPYIHENPLRNGLVHKARNWKYSSLSNPTLSVRN